MYVKQTAVADGGSSGSSMYIGFNIKKADEMIEKIKEEYNNLGIYTSEQWGPLKSTLRKEWVGPDELDFEKKLVERICALYVQAHGLAQKCTMTLADLSCQWVDFQRKNTIDGSTIGSWFDYGIESMVQKIRAITQGMTGLTYNDAIITFTNDLVLDDYVSRGLTSSTSKANIQAAVNDFVTAVKTRTNNLFNAIETGNAFFGEQSTAIKSYIEATGFAIAEVTTAVKDMNDALEVLANSSYSGASSEVSSIYASAKSSMEATADDLGSSRWT